MRDFYLCYPAILTNTLVPQLGLSSIVQNQLGVALDALTTIALGGTVLPRHSMVLPLWCGTSEVLHRAVLPCLGTVLPRRQGRVGVMTRAGEVQLPIPMHCPLSTSLPLKNGAGGPRRISVSGHSPRIPTGGIVPHHFLLPWTKVFPQIPLFLGCSLASRFLGRCLLFLRF